MLLFQSLLIKIPRYLDAIKLQPDAFGFHDGAGRPFQKLLFGARRHVAALAFLSPRDNFIECILEKDPF